MTKTQELKGLISYIGATIKMTEMELKRFTFATIQMDERDIEDLAKIKTILQEIEDGKYAKVG